MSAIIPIPMLLPSPYASLRYAADYGGYAAASAVREQTTKQAANHREVLGALEELAKGKIAVTVQAQDVLPVVTAVLAELEGPAADYDTALAKWNKRYARIRAWQNNRKEAKRKAEREREGAEREAMKEAAAQEYMRKHSRWWRRVTIERAREQVAYRFVDYGEGYYSVMRSFYRADWDFLHLLPSHPKKPNGYDDLPALRELRDAASLSPAAVLSVPVEVVTKLQRWTA